MREENFMSEKLFEKKFCKVNKNQLDIMSTLGWNSDLNTQDSDLLVRRQLTLD